MTVRGALPLAVAATAWLFVAALPVEAAPCDAPANAIVAENCREGSPREEWDVADPRGTSVEGFTTDISVDQGATVAFKIRADAPYTLAIYRLGWYGGDGARKVGDAVLSGAPLSQPGCDTDGDTGRVSCANWAVSASWAVPANATSGLHLAVAMQGGEPIAHIPFVVRDDDGGSDLLFQTSDTTWQAYNRFGGNSLYTGSPADRAYKVSYDRPFTTAAYAEEDWLFNAEYPMVRWLERNGYDVSYFTGVDSDRRGDELREHKTFLSVGHDEYWSGGQRANVTAARDAGVNLAFFSGNEVFWKTRWEDNHRTLVSYKETHANAKIDPTSAWTGTWRDPRPFNPEGGQPENALTGTSFAVNSGTVAIQVPSADGKLRFWRGTDVAALAPGATATLTDGTLGYEWDADPDNGARPAGLVRMSSTTAAGVEVLQDYGTNYGSGTATHHLTLYRDANDTGPDALVFGAGTVQWPWGLDGLHARGSTIPSVAMQQATTNLLADMGAQPASIQAELQPATASADRTPPTAALANPGAIAVQAGVSATVGGTATDAGGGRVGAVEVSVDNGASWHPATGREAWSYSWIPAGDGTVTPLVRAADDSGNLTGTIADAPATPTPGGGQRPPSGATPVTKPGGGARTARVTILSKHLRMSRRGVITLRLRCAAGGPDCHVKLRLRRHGRRVAGATADVPSGTIRVVALTLRRPVRRLVVRRRAVGLIAVTTVGSARPTSTAIRVRAPGKRP